MAKILLVDDDSAIATVFSMALTQGGFQVITINEGSHVLEKAKEEKPDFILLDQILPDMKGNDILKQLKADSLTKPIPVAMLSNFGQQELIEEAIKEGSVDYILKYQIEAQDLVKKVQSLLEDSNMEKKL